MRQELLRDGQADVDQQGCQAFGVAAAADKRARQGREFLPAVVAEFVVDDAGDRGEGRIGAAGTVAEGFTSEHGYQFHQAGAVVGAEVGTGAQQG
ncbi:hypothetical protein ACIA59_23740 [Micromonospora haikouensis]|uniref:hypothetical protein n=1 Tax=Micromonospora haikouensis TaxID=686309 RepID=UPI003788E1DC